MRIVLGPGDRLEVEWDGSETGVIVVAHLHDRVVVDTASEDDAGRTGTLFEEKVERTRKHGE